MYLENIAYVEELVVNCIFEVVVDILSITHSSNEIRILLDNNALIEKLSSSIIFVKIQKPLPFRHVFSHHFSLDTECRYPVQRKYKRHSLRGESENSALP